MNPSHTNNLFNHKFTKKYLELFLNYHTRPKSNNIPIEQIVNEVTTSQQPEKEQTTCSSTNHTYQNIPKQQPKEKIWTIPLLLESPKCKKDFQPPDLEIEFLIDSGAESNIINIPTWNEIKILHPKITPIKTTSILATAQGSILTNYGKIQLFLVPTKTMEQNKLLNKPFKQIFHITDIKHNIIEIPFITKNIPTNNILDSKINIKDKYTRKQNTASAFFHRMYKQPPFFSKFYSIYSKERKYLKPLSGHIYEFLIKQVNQYDKKQNRQHLFMSDFEFGPYTIKYMKTSNSDMISLHVYYNSPYKITLSFGLLGYCENDATTSSTKKVAYRVNIILQLLDICQSIILD